jgi:UDPglucose--hexose-1-phosphate uridylyltransferase
MPELRQDPISGRWVIFSRERAARPSDLAAPPPPPAAGSCPFCPGNEAETPPEILALRPDGSPPDTPGWTLRVVPNRYPALLRAGEPRADSEGLYRRLDGVGAHEVIIESPAHERGLAELPAAQVAAVLAACRRRIAELDADPRLRYVLVFKNHGAAAGASLAHPHAQLLATPLVPLQVQEELEGARRHHESRQRCVFCDVVAQETGPGGGRRLVLARAGLAVLAPYAARFPYETWILPLAHASAFERGDAAQDAALAEVLGETLRRLGRVLPGLAYNLVLHTAPCRAPALAHYHWHVEILPRLAGLAGFEWGSGFCINPVLPEDAAAALRAAEG